MCAYIYIYIYITYRHHIDNVKTNEGAYRKTQANIDNVNDKNKQTWHIM